MATGVIPGIADWLTGAIKGIPGLVQGIPSSVKGDLSGTNTGQEINVKSIPPPTGTVSNPLAQLGSSLGHALYTPAPPPAPATTPASQTVTTTGPTYNDLAKQAIEPIIKSLGTTPAALSAAIGPGGNTPYGGQGGGTISQNIASTMNTMVGDYQSGLNAMLQTIGTEQPTQSILKGMESLLSYPVGLTGQSGAPGGVETTPFLQTLYATLNAQRSGLAPPSTSTAGSGYNATNAVTQAALGNVSNTSQ